MSSAFLSRKQALPAASRGRGRAVCVRPAAFFNKGKTQADEEVEAPATQPRKKEGLFSQTVSTLEGAVPRSKRDAELLYEAKYGKRGEDGKMSREQYQALRRKIGGTSRDFFKDWVEEDRVENTYYKPGSAGGSVPYLPLLVGVVLAVLATTVLVVQQTSV